MKMKIMLMIAMVCFVGQVVCGAFDLVVTQDASVRTGTTSDPAQYGWNWGVGEGLWLMQGTSGGDTKNQGNKAYHLFDATGLAPVTRVESITVYWFQTNRVGRLGFYFIDPVDGMDTWIEGDGNGDNPLDTLGGITWNTAPGNNVTGNDSTFAAYSGETVYFLGDRSSGADGAAYSGKPITLAIDEGSALEAALLYALNNGDRKVTIGVNNFGGTSYTGGITIGSRERGVDGEFAAKMTVVPEPATLALLGMGGLALLRKRK